MKHVSLLAAISLLAIMQSAMSVAVAQDYRARVQGVVNDPTKAAIVGATVTLINTQTGVTVTKTTAASGQYVFDFVQPGTYRVTVDAPGFQLFLRDNITVLTAGDVTVDALMAVGSVSDTVSVSATALMMEYNTSTMAQTVDGRMLQDLPVLSRNPFTLTLLDPAVTNGYWDVEHRNPFFSQASNGVDVGNTLGRNDVLVDGVTVVLGSRVGYVPPMDAVQEVSVQQNAVDAQFGESAGGVMSLSMKSGTNSIHGGGYYFGRNPALNAVASSVTHSANQDRYNIGGGNIGFPIKKNKLFAFGSYEQWRSQFPTSYTATLPTDLERTGDFSKSLNGSGGLRTLYDPWSTTLNSATGAVSRTPFAGNVIPGSRMDPSAQIFLKDVWKPNTAGDNVYTHANNYKLTFPWWSDYKNWSGRTDWIPSEKWKVYGRYSQFREWESNNNYAHSPAFTDQDGGLTATISAVGDVVWVINPSTVLDLRAGIVRFGIDYDSPWAELSGGKSGLAKFWPNNAWYDPYMADMNKFFYPRLNVGTFYSGMTGLWYHKPSKTSYEAGLVTHKGSHNLKYGASWRHEWEYTNLPDPMNFTFPASMTADTFLSPNTAVSGDAWGSFLLGALTGYASYEPRMLTRDNQWAGYAQDDYKVNRWLTLNLGLRVEWESAIAEDQNRMSRSVDLTNPIQEMKTNVPQMPSEVTQYGVTPTYNGAWSFANKNHPGVFNAPHPTFLPRVGAAIRVNDLTAIRAGYARYASNLLAVIGPSWNVPQYGYTATTTVESPLQGVPQATLSNPFPSANPLLSPVGNSLGRYTNLGNSGAWFHQDLKTPINDRFNVSLQRALPAGFRLDVTYFLNLGHNIQPPGNGGGTYESRNVNMMNPQIGYKYGSALDKQVANPFYGYGTTQTFPGQLRNLSQVPVSYLLRPYPQYQTLTEDFLPGFSEHYHSLQMKGERAFSKGFSLMAAYNFSREASDSYFNDDAQYANTPTMLSSPNSRHRISAAGTYDLPFGKGRTYLNNIHPVLNTILGGWTTSHVLTWNSGSFLRFAQMTVSGDPVLSNPTKYKWFNTSVFTAPAAYTPRTNPYQYDGLTGPRFWQLDSTLSKSFQLTERFRLEFRMEAYNTVNTFIPANPDTNVYNSTFGMSTSQANYGREMQYALKLYF